MTREKLRSVIDAMVKMRGLATDEQALEIKAIYPEWKSETKYISGDRVEYQGKLYKVITNHSSQSDWTPIVAHTLFQPIDVVNEGSLANPIIAAAGMCYFKDKYYLDETDGKIYLCTRDDSNGNGTVLHFVPSALVGTYFEVI